MFGLCINYDKSEMRSEGNIYDISYDLKWNVKSSKSLGIVSSLRVEEWSRLTMRKN